jgi:hypothetical protein
MTALQYIASVLAAAGGLALIAWLIAYALVRTANCMDRGDE